MSPFKRIKVDLKKKKRTKPTWEVPTATSGASSHPATLVDRHRPAVPFIPLQRVGGQVAHLQLGEIPREIIKGHPGAEQVRRMNQVSFSKDKSVHRWKTLRKQ